jgi:3-oxoacyl-[acyl-carrier protein] reductase
MDFGIKTRVAMVAAASKGIGKAVANSLLNEGCHLSICARRQDKLQKTQTELQKAATDQEIISLSCDVSDGDDLRNWHNLTKKKFGKVDILITNTGGPPAGRFLDLTEKQWREGIESTLMNVIHLCHLVIPGMRKQKWGRIVHITSLAAKQPLDILTVSNTLRAGLSALTKTLSNQLARDGICVNALLPGHILTDRQLELNRLKSSELGITAEEYANKVQIDIPAGRYGQPKEIGDVVAFLCSEQASYLTGTSLQVDGGLIKSTF